LLLFQPLTNTTKIVLHGPIQFFSRETGQEAGRPEGKNTPVGKEDDMGSTPLGGIGDFILFLLGW
jgi:hypothetical protein